MNSDSKNSRIEALGHAIAGLAQPPGDAVAIHLRACSDDAASIVGALLRAREQLAVRYCELDLEHVALTLSADHAAE
jgi:hypothetical protein